MDELKENLKTLLRKAINNAKDGDEKGEWITINGTHVFIPEGKTAEDVIKEKGWKEKGDSNNKEYKTGDKITFDTNWRGVNPKIQKGEIVGLEKKLGSHGDANPDYQYKVKLEDGKTILIDKEAIQEGKEKSDKKEFNYNKLEKTNKYNVIDPYSDEEQEFDNYEDAKRHADKIKEAYKKDGNSDPNIQIDEVDKNGEYVRSMPEKSDKPQDNPSEKGDAFHSDNYNGFSKKQVLEIIADEHKTGLDWDELRDELFDSYGISLKTKTFSDLRKEAIKDTPPEGKKGSKQPENWDERKDKKNIEKKLTDIAKKRFDTIETLETQHSDSKDFHDLAVWGIKDVLTEAYQEGAGNKNKVSEKILADIAKKEMNIPTLEERHSDSDDFHDVSVWSLKEALKKAFLAGEKNKSDNSIKNGLSEIIKNCKPETKEDLKILKGLKDILEKQ